jgi:hypothetical protein
MATERDPSLQLIAKLRRVRIAGVGALVALAVWTFWPQGASSSQSVEAAKAKEAPKPDDVRWVAPNLAVKPEPLDIRAFDAQLWKLPPKPVEVAAATPPPPPPPPPPLKLQLVGILTNAPTEASSSEIAAGSRAALFDPDSSKVYSVAEGGKVLRYRVKSISAEAVELVDAQLPLLPPYVLKMRSSEFKPTPVVRKTPGTGKSQAAPPVSSNLPAAPHSPPEDLASGGSR